MHIRQMNLWAFEEFPSTESMDIEIFVPDVAFLPRVGLIRC
jgi:hypothetical protein